MAAGVTRVAGAECPSSAVGYPFWGILPQPPLISNRYIFLFCLCALGELCGNFLLLIHRDITIGVGLAAGEFPIVGDHDFDKLGQMNPRLPAQ